MKYLTFITVLVLLSCNTNTSVSDTNDVVVSNTNPTTEYNEMFIDRYTGDSSIYICYSHLIYSDSTCPQKKLWSKIELHRQNETILIDSGTLVTPTSGWSNFSNMIVYSYRQLMMGSEEFNADENIKNKFCTIDVPDFSHIDIDVKRGDQLILSNYNELNLGESLDGLARKGYEFNTVQNAWLNNGQNGGAGEDTIFALSDIIYRDVSFMNKYKKSISTIRIKKYLDFIDEGDLMNSGYKNDFIVLFKTIIQFGNTNEKQLV